MIEYDARDLVRVPSLLSLARIPLAAAFPIFVSRPAIAIAILFAAGASDVLDGWYARRYKQVTAIGALVDPITDKLFVASVALSLLAVGKLSVPVLLLLGTRDMGELPLIAWLALDRRARERIEDSTSNLLGKTATALQFATVVAVVSGLSPKHVVLAATITAVIGVAAAFSYWVATLARVRSVRARRAS